MARNVWNNVNFNDSNIAGYAKDVYGVNQAAINSIKSLINVGQDIENQTKDRNSLALLDKLSAVTNPEEFNAVRAGVNLADLNKTTQNSVLAQTQKNNNELEQRSMSNKMIELLGSKDPIKQKELLLQRNQENPLDVNTIGTLQSVIDKNTKKQDKTNFIKNNYDSIVNGVEPSDDNIQLAINSGNLSGAETLIALKEKAIKNKQELSQLGVKNILTGNDSNFITPPTTDVNSNIPPIGEQFIPINRSKLNPEQIRNLTPYSKEELAGVVNPLENTGLNTSQVNTQNNINSNNDTANLFSNSYNNFYAALAQTDNITDPKQRAKAVEDINKELEINKNNDVKNYLVKNSFDKKDAVKFLNEVGIAPKNQKEFVDFFEQNKDISKYVSAYNEVIYDPINLPVKNMVTNLTIDVKNLKNQLESNPEVNARNNINTTLKTFNNQPQEKTLTDATNTISSLSGQDYSESYVKKVATRVANNHLQKYGKSVSVNDVLAAMTYSTESAPGSILTLGYNDTFNEDKILDNVRKYKTDPNIAATDKVYKNKAEDLSKYEKRINELQQRIGFNYNRNRPYSNEIKALNKIQDEVRILLNNNAPKEIPKEKVTKVLNKITNKKEPASYLYGKGIM